MIFLKLINHLIDYKGSKKEINLKLKKETMKKYIIDNQELFNLIDVLEILQQNFGVDYQNNIIKVS